LAIDFAQLEERLPHRLIECIDSGLSGDTDGRQLIASRDPLPVLLLGAET
jgi:hypothetical protein